MPKHGGTGCFSAMGESYRWPRIGTSGAALRMVAMATLGRVRDLAHQVGRADLKTFPALGKSIPERTFGRFKPLHKKDCVASPAVLISMRTRSPGNPRAFSEEASRSLTA